MVMPLAYGAAALLFAIFVLGALAAAIGFIRVRIWWGAASLMLLALMFAGAAISFVQRAFS